VEPKPIVATTTMSMQEQLKATGVRILRGAEQPMFLSFFFEKVYRELGGEARQVVQKSGGAIKWLQSMSTHFKLHPATGVGNEAVSLQPRSAGQPLPARTVNAPLGTGQGRPEAIKPLAPKKQEGKTEPTSTKDGPKDKSHAKNDKGSKGDKSAGDKDKDKASMQQQLVAAGMRLLRGEDTPMFLSFFFEKLYRELGGEARQAVQKFGGAIKWLQSMSTHFKLHPATGVGNEAVSLHLRAKEKAKLLGTDEGAANEGTALVE